MKFLKKTFLIISKLIIFMFVITGCSSDEKLVFSKISNENDLVAYKSALSLSLSGKNDKAAIKFESISNDFPYSNLSSKAEIMSAYSYYENNEIKKTILKLNNFIEMNPSDEFSDYAHYLLAMCYYIQVSNDGRDPSLAKQALNYFKTIEIKYPNGKYAKDSKLKIQYLKNQLALNELLIGVFYLRKNSPTAAIKRFKTVLKDYQNSSVIPETLYRLCEALLMLGLKDEAYKSKALLNYNFSKNKWSLLSENLFDTKLNDIENKGMIVSIKNYFNTIFD